MQSFVGVSNRSLRLTVLDGTEAVCRIQRTVVLIHGRFSRLSRFALERYFISASFAYEMPFSACLNALHI